MVHISLKLKQTGPKSVGSTLNCFVCVCVCVCVRAHAHMCKFSHFPSLGVCVHTQFFTFQKGLLAACDPCGISHTTLLRW